MNDAISRSAVLRQLDEYIDLAIENQVHYSMCTVANFIEELPALDVAPVVHARWIEDGYRGIPCVCSRCGEEAHYMSIFKEQFDYDWDENLVPCGYEEIREYIRSKCCPECGARMDGDADA